MNSRLFAAALVAIVPALASAQQRPTTAQAQQALERPDIQTMVRSRINTSGLTPDQIRARLKAAGYPEGLLDDYMGTTSPTGKTAAPSEDVFRAVRFLGIVDSLDLAAARSGVETSTGPVPAPSRPAPRTPGRLFGLDVFRNATSQFEPDLAGPVDASYRVGPRDILTLILTGGVETSYALEVTREGFVVVPQVGQIQVANLTLGQIEELFYQRLRSAYSGIGRGEGASTRFSVTITKLRTIQVNVTGEVNSPSAYNISAAGTLLTALYSANGPSDNGSLRNIELRRGTGANNRVMARVDLYDYLLNGDASKNLRLEQGDHVFVPIHGPRVEITGQVIRPATFEVKAGETLRDLVRMAGGFTAQAGRRRVLVNRVVPPAQRAALGGRDRTVIDITSDEFASGFGPAIPLEDGDIVEVLKVADRVRNLINVQGAVWTPGEQGFSSGTRLSDALKRAGGVRPDVKTVIVTRLQSDLTREVLRANFRDTLGTLVQDLTLQEDDSVHVFGTSDFRPDRYVIITGAVHEGGRYPWREGMTMRDLVAIAHGLGDGALLTKAEVARLPASPQTPGVVAVSIPVAMDSTYLFERGLDGKYIGPPGVPVPAATAPDFEIKPYDNVLILRQPDWQLERLVTVLGEVKFPGSYTLMTKTDRISDLVARAGGQTERAYFKGAVFTRPSGGAGRIGIDLDVALRDPKHRDNLVLVAGDTLYIPTFRPTVRVGGAVNSPITLAYVPGQNLSKYVRGAGGPTFAADKAHAYVQQPTGIVEPYKKRFWILPDRDPEPLAGASVVVPMKDPNDKKDWTGIAGSVAQALASAVAIVAIMRRF